MGVCGCVIPNPNCLCHSTPNYLVTMPKSVLDQIGKEHTEEVKRLRQQVSELVDALEQICSLRTIPLKNRELRVRLLSSIDIAKSAIAKATGGE